MDDQPRTVWKRASRSADAGSVEVATNLHGAVAVRDAKDVNNDGPILVYTRAEWAAFIEGVKAGEFDL